MSKTIKVDYWGGTSFEIKGIVNPETYSGRGRPKKSDYINLIELQRLFNKATNERLEFIREKAGLKKEGKL